MKQPSSKLSSNKYEKTERIETQFSNIYLDLKKGGIKTKMAFQILQKMGYSKTLRTLNYHNKTLIATNHALKTVRRNNKIAALNANQMNQMDNWVKMKNSTNSPFQLADVKKEIYASFAIDITCRTAGNIMKRLGHTIKTCQVKTSGFQKINDQLKEEYWTFILKMRKENRFARAPKEIRSIDVTYTKKPTIHVKTFSPKGGFKQKSKFKVDNYTNAIVTMVSGDGINHTPCLLFTYDPKFSRVQKNTERGNRIHQELVTALEKYNITEDRIIYQNNNKNYYAESPDMYEHFLNHYGVPKDTLILHDNGNAYKRRSVSIFDSNGFQNHVIYPSDVHQYLSPNDNNLHGCKSTWFEEYHKFENDVAPALRLMELIDLETVKNSKRYFQNNLFHVKKSDLSEIIGD